MVSQVVAGVHGLRGCSAACVARAKSEIAAHADFGSEQLGETLIFRDLISLATLAAVFLILAVT